MKRKMLCVIMVLVMLVSSACLPSLGVFAASGNREYEDEYGKSYLYRYINNNQEVYLVDFLSSETGELKIPSYIDGKPVTVIGKEAFIYVDATSVVIPDTVVQIESQAFYDTELKTVHISESVVYIDPSAFIRSGKLKEYTVSEDNPVYMAKDGVLYSKDETVLVSYPIGKFPVYPHNKEIVIPESVEYIYDYAFAYLDNVFRLEIPGSVKVIGKNAFFNTSLAFIYFNEGLLYIDDYAFSGTKSLQKPQLPSTLMYVGADAFRGVGWEDSYIGIYNINHIAYRYRGNFKEIAIDEHITTIAPKCFSEEGKELERIYIPASVDEIDLTAFDNCSSLTEIIVNENNEVFTTYDGMLYTKDMTYLLVCPANKAGIVKVHEDTEVIMSRAFRGCGSITEIVLLDKVESIGYEAFAYCSALEKISVPESVASLGEDLFVKCENLLDLKINCNTSAVCDYDLADTQWYENQPDGVLRIGNIALGYKNMYEDTTKVSFDKDIKVIAYTSFMGYYNLKEVVLPENLETIGMWAFGNCSNLKSINVPPTVTEIGECALGYNYYYDEVTGESTLEPVEGFTIKGYTNSAADAYARKHGFNFESVGKLNVTLLTGDTDFDNTVTIKDVTLIQKYLAFLVDFVQQQKINADMNSDGEVNIKDATAIQKHLAGLDF